MTSMSDKIKIVCKVLTFFIPYLFRLATQRIDAIRHRWTWHSMSDAKAVIVFGGSFAGIELARRLSETLPTGY